MLNRIKLPRVILSQVGLDCCLLSQGKSKQINVPHYLNENWVIAYLKKAIDKIKIVPTLVLKQDQTLYSVLHFQSKKVMYPTYI